ncbi:MAG TPA: hypothetical protein VJ124_11300 [Pyrinomonadaceae bacterium]|nr:hypothetical protein [Pyrinomonadaceae bacterium]
MGRIDDRAGKVREQSQKQDLASELADEIIEKGLIPFIPNVGWLLALILGFIRSRGQNSMTFFEEQILEYCEALEKDLDALKEEVQSDERIQRLIAVGVERIFWGASQAKAQRFAAVIANTVASEKSDRELEDAASYIHALDELSDDDLKVLRHLYKHQAPLVQENHTMDPGSFYKSGGIVAMLRDVGYLRMQMDDFYSRCERLSGYGLAMRLERRPLEILENDRPFRMTLSGKRLVDILRITETRPVDKST